MHPAKTQISLGIRPIWSESSLSAWRNLGPLATHWAHSEDSDQTGQRPRLIWVFAGAHSFCWFCHVEPQILSFGTDKHEQTVRTQIRLLLNSLIRIFSLPFFIFMVKPHGRPCSISLPVTGINYGGPVTDDCSLLLTYISDFFCQVALNTSFFKWVIIGLGESFGTDKQLEQSAIFTFFFSFLKHWLYFWEYIQHAYQSLACETTFSTDFSQLFSLKRIYVKYKNAILWLIDCFFRTWKD